MEPTPLEEHPLAKDLSQGFLEGLGPIDDGQPPLTVQRKAPLLNRGQEVSDDFTVLRVPLTQPQRDFRHIRRNPQGGHPHAAPNLQPLDHDGHERILSQWPFVDAVQIFLAGADKGPGHRRARHPQLLGVAVDHLLVVPGAHAQHHSVAHLLI